MVEELIEPVWYLPGVAERFGAAKPIWLQRCSRHPRHVRRARDAERFLKALCRYWRGDVWTLDFGDVTSIRISTRLRLPSVFIIELTGPTRFGLDIARAVLLTRRTGIEERVPSARIRVALSAPSVISPGKQESARRGDEFPRLQRAQTPSRRRPRGSILRAHRVRGRRARHALSGAHARQCPHSAWHDED